MTTIGNIGVGLFVLILLWITALIIFVFAIKFGSNIGWLALLFAISTTLVLLIIPLEKEEQQFEEFVVLV